MCLCRDASAAVVCFAVNDAASWERLKFWVSELRQQEAACRIYVAATKVDLLQVRRRESLEAEKCPAANSNYNQ